MRRCFSLFAIGFLALFGASLLVPGTARAGSLLTEEVAKLVPAGLNASDQFGRSLAVSGDTVVVGAYLDDDFGTNAGAAYVFRHNQGSADGWGMVVKLSASDAAAGDLFGDAVSIGGDTVVVGARGDDDAGADSGAAYVFRRNQGGPDAWGQVAKLTASDAASEDRFGWSVAVSDDTVVVGAREETGAGSDSGAAYVFARNQGGADAWGEVAKLTASDAAAFDNFGGSVGISKSTIVVGAIGADGNRADSGAAYVFARNQGGANAWGEVAKLFSSDGVQVDLFGEAVAIWNDTIVVGARGNDDAGQSSGSAYLFERNEGGAEIWGQSTKLTASDAAGGDGFGYSVDVWNDSVVVGAVGDDDGGAGSGSAYFFERNRGGADAWGELQKLLPSDGATGDTFGRAVALDGETVVVGADLDDTVAADTGSAYVFRRSGSIWTEIRKRAGSDTTAGDNFGRPSLDGDILVDGAPFADPSGKDGAGAAYVFYRNFDPASPGTPAADNWGEVTKLVASDGAAGDRFSVDISISGDTVAIGADFDDDSGTDSGAVYIFQRNQGGADAWGEVTKVTPLDGAAGDEFGTFVALSGDTLLVGARRDDSESGSAYVFRRNEGGANAWGQVKKLTASDAASGDQFGGPVSLEGDRAHIGARNDDVGSGATYVFERNFDPADPGIPLADNWGEVEKLVASDRASGDGFGFLIDLQGGLAAAGARIDDNANGTDAGAVYLFRRNFDPSNPGTPLADNWGELVKLTASDGSATDNFGLGTTLEGSRLFAGAPGEDSSASDAGAVYVFERNVDGPDAWGETAKIMPSDIAAGDSFGAPIAVSGNRFAAPAGLHDASGTDAGAVWLFELSAPESDLAVTKTNGQTETVPGTTTTYTITVTNAGPENVTGAVVTDTFDGTRMDEINISWTCAPSTGSGVGTDCPPSGVGADLVAGVSVDVEAGDAVIFTVDVPVLASATGTLVNTAAVALPSGTLDPISNNEATDSDTLTPEVDLAVAKNDGRDFAEIGGPLTYTILVSNSAGPSDAPGTTVSDTFPAELTCTWSCAGASGGTCGAASGSGDLAETADLPAGGSVTYTVDCAIDAGAFPGVITNTATAAPASGVTDIDPSNDSGSDSTELTTCGEPNDLVLENQTISTIETFTACQTITAGSGFVVDGTGDVTFRAGTKVILDDGFSVEAGGGLAVEIDSGLGQ